MNIVRQKTSAEYSTRNKIQLIRGGKEYFNLLLHLINKATDRIHLQTYIYDEDETGLLVANALKAAGFTKLLTLFNKLPLLKCIAGKRTEIPATFAVIIIYKVEISIILLSVFINAKNYNNIFLQLLLEGLAA